MLKCDQLEEGEELIFAQKDLKHNRQQGGQINFYNDDYDVFSSSQWTQNTISTRGGGGDKLWW